MLGGEAAVGTWGTILGPSVSLGLSGKASFEVGELLLAQRVAGPASHWPR